MSLRSRLICGTSAACAAVLALSTLVVWPADAATRTWYVRAGAPAGNGSSAKPFRALSSVERASLAGDVIRILPSTSTLDGGIRLKPRQQLIGSGPAVTSLGRTSPAPKITNTTRAWLSGDAVRLADGAVVSNLRIPGAFRGAVYGLNVSGVSVTGNDVYGQNASCTPGFLIPQFNAPTTVPGVGVPIVGGLQNGWAGIMVDGSSRRAASALISRNVVHDAECGDGIDVRTWGTAGYTVRIIGNKVHSLRQGEDFRSILAIGLQARDTSQLSATIENNSQAKLGNPDDPNIGPEGADTEGVFVNGVGPSTLRAVVTGNRYTNEPGVGGFSGNGLEMVTMGNGSQASVIVRDSHFSGSTGDVIEEGALGTNARLDMLLERVTAERTTGYGNTVVLPFNNGDCVLAGSLGAGNDVRLTVRRSVLRECDNNGLAIGSNVANGTGPTKNIMLDVSDSVITGNKGPNLGIRNFTELENITVKIARTDLGGSESTSGSGASGVLAEDLGNTTRSVIDLGGGALGSVGGNCLTGGAMAADVVRYAVVARHNWWGQPGGPGPLRTLTLGGSLDAGDPLATAPRYCSGL